MTKKASSKQIAVGGGIAQAMGPHAHASLTIVKRAGTELLPSISVPPLPTNFVARPEVIDAMCEKLLGGDRRPGEAIALTAVTGMGGIGKTVLTEALCRDERVRKAFPGDIFWQTIGKESTVKDDLRIRAVVRALRGRSRDLEELEAASAIDEYRNLMRGKAVLVVLDDIWRVGDLQPWLTESERSCLLFTTRDASIAVAVGAQEHLAELLSEDQAREVFARWAGITGGPHWPETEEIIGECKRLPLALSIVGAMLRGKPRDLWKRTLEVLRRADLAKIKAQFPNYPYPNLFVAIKVSVDALEPFEQERYCALAVLLEEMAVPRAIQQTLWGTDAGEAAEIAERFVSLSLAQRDVDGETIRLHDLQLGYVRSQHQDQEGLRLLQGAVRLSSHVIQRDPSQFASQLLGRLLGSDSPSIQAVLLHARRSKDTACLWPINRSLIPPGGPLLRTLEGHRGWITAVAITGDGGQAVSASWDNTLKVWELKTGKLLHTLWGHSDGITAVAITGDGEKAVSASWDNTLKVWELKTGKLLHTLEGHSGGVRAVAITGDGEQAVSASSDQTVKIWELRTGRVMTTFSADGDVEECAASPDGDTIVAGDLLGRVHFLRWEKAGRR